MKYPRTKRFSMRVVLSAQGPGEFRACVRTGKAPSASHAALIRGRSYSCGSGSSPRAALQKALRAHAKSMKVGIGYGKRTGHKRYGGR